MDYISFNSNLMDSNAHIAPAQNAKLVYEVVRVIQGKVLFWESHALRLKNSLTIEAIDADDKLQILDREIKRVIDANYMTEGNIMIQIIKHGQNCDLLIKVNPHHYPSPKEYAQGVRVGLLEAERVNPEAKVVQHNLRARANNMIAKDNLYEVLLVDANNKITEGSRSNVIFIKGNTIVIPPMNRVLKGITLEKVIEIANHMKIEIIESSIETNTLNTFDAACITGTSPKILPIQSTNAYTYDVNNQMLRQLMKLYDKLMLKSLN